MESTLFKYIESFYRLGEEIAYVHHRGYRTAYWSYRAVGEGASRLARELECRGIGKGDRILLWGENCAEWVVAFLGCVLRGAIVVPMDRIASPDFAARVFKQIEARLCLCSHDLTDRIPKIPTLELDTLVEMTSRHSGTPCFSTDVRREDTVQIVFTSGTTADPKGVVLTHKNILANLEPLEVEIQKYLRYERPFHPLRFLNLLPLSHVFGQFLGVLCRRYSALQSSSRTL
jgi:long-chain acyl-CoA synthetase